MIPLLTQSYRTAAAVAGYLIVAHGATARSAVLATSATDPLIGAVGELGSFDGGMADVVKVGVSSVRLGGSVANGDPLTSKTAAGKAVKAVKTAGTNVRIIGFAESPGEADDVIDYFVAPGFLSNPA